MPYAILERERHLWKRGITKVAGVDEAGRGALAGPVVAAAVLMRPEQWFSAAVRDSKQLTSRRRLGALKEIEKVAWAIGVGIADVEEIEAVNIKQASRLAMQRAVEALQPRPDYLLVDAETVPVDLPQDVLIKGDQLSQAVAAASIVAKVTRDRMANLWDEHYPLYGFARHKGYATREHRQMVQRWGPCPLHRPSFLSRILSAHWQASLDFGREIAPSSEVDLL